MGEILARHCFCFFFNKLRSQYLQNRDTIYFVEMLKANEDEKHLATSDRYYYRLSPKMPNILREALHCHSKAWKLPRSHFLSWFLSETISQKCSVFSQTTESLLVVLILVKQDNEVENSQVREMTNNEGNVFYPKFWVFPNKHGGVCRLIKGKLSARTRNTLDGEVYCTLQWPQRRPLFKNRFQKRLIAILCFLCQEKKS